MTELIETAGIATIDLDKHSDDDCPFCQSKENEPEINENNFTQLHDEDVAETLGLVAGIKGYKHKNCSGALGTAMGGASTVPALRGITRDDWDHELEVAYAAHHLIPGDGSLVKSKLHKSGKYLRHDKQEEGNIGYNVNNKQNGEWLPGNYAYSQKSTGSEWGKKGAKLKAIHDVAPDDYVAEVIDKSNRQFHDAHRAYNGFVKDQLDKIENKLGQATEQPWCPEGKKKSEEKPEEIRPLYVLVGRLGHLSSRMKRKLTFPTSGWNTNIYTSSFARDWMVDFNRKAGE